MAEDKRPMEVDDLYKIVTVEDPRISPDGKWVAFVRVTVDKMENSYSRTIWLRATDGGDPIQLTRGGKDSQPRWSPDSQSLAFTSGRGDKPQIYVLSIASPGGEARQLTNAKNGASSPDWSHDGSRIAYLAGMNIEEREKEDSSEEEEPPADKLEVKHRKERQEEDDKAFYDPYFMWRVPYRVGTSFLSGRYAQIYTIAVDEKLDEDAKKPARLTSVDVNHEQPHWSVDDKFIYTARQIDPTQDEPFTRQAIYRINVDTKAIEQLTDDTFTSAAAVPSPDGKLIAFIRRPCEKRLITDSQVRLSVMSTEGGEVRDLNMELDRSFSDFVWSHDSQHIYFTPLSEGDGSVARLSVADGKVETRASGTFKAMELDVSAAGDVAFTVATPISPTELAWLPTGTSNYEQITAFNHDFLNEIVVQETHELRFTNPHGDEIQGWYILPVGYTEGEQYPLALNIHGGPHVMWGPSEPTMFHEWQLHAASGYVVFYCNPRGGDGYGEAFLKALHAAWGDVAHEDIMAGVDTLLEKGFVDEKRMALTGGSYGGYMTAWIVGHTDRFASAVSQRGVYNLASFYGTSDIPVLISSEFDVEPWEDYDLLWKHSPLAYAHKIKTPLLIIHSENDYRVPIEQGEQLFAYVRRSGGTVEMYRYPRDGHELSRSGEPKHRVSRLTNMVEWFDKYCKPE